MKTKTKTATREMDWIDLKKGDRLILYPFNLLIRVDEVGSGGELYLHTCMHRKVLVRPRRYYNVCMDAGIYNFGNRGLGRRGHIRIDLEDGCWFEHRKTVRGS